MAETPELVVNMIAEGAKLAAYELRTAGAGELPRRAARGLDTVMEMAREGMRLGEYEVSGRRK